MVQKKDFETSSSIGSYFLVCRRQILVLGLVQKKSTMPTCCKERSRFCSVFPVRT